MTAFCGGGGVLIARLAIRSHCGLAVRGFGCFPFGCGCWVWFLIASVSGLCVLFTFVVSYLGFEGGSDCTSSCSLLSFCYKWNSKK